MDTRMRQVVLIVKGIVNQILFNWHPRLKLNVVVNEGVAMIETIFKSMIYDQPLANCKKHNSRYR